MTEVMKRYTAIFAALLCVCACQNRPSLIILHTNDTHSHLEPVRGGEYDGLGGVIERAVFVDSVRAAEGADRVLLLDAGDFSQGTSYFTELNGVLEPEILDDMKYDVACLGNHEFDNDIEALTERVKRLKYTQVVCANLDFSQFELGKYVKPYAIVERGGMKIGVIGVDAVLEGCVSKVVSDRIQQLDDAEVVNRWASYLHDEEPCDLVILLSHKGYEEDQELVPLISGVDIVVGGHSHTFVDDILYVADSQGKNVPIVTDGCWGVEVGKLSVYGRKKRIR